jgi:F-type H+-transporting ATPase subunit gamma
MPSTRDIRRRIKSIKNTAQITKAMQMVASSKMRKAQLAALAGRPYATLMNDILAAVSEGSGDFSDPLMEKRPVRKRAVIVVSTDKGLCGALNSNLLREAGRLDKDTTLYICAGRKGRNLSRAPSDSWLPSSTTRTPPSLRRRVPSPSSLRTCS